MRSAFLFLCLVGCSGGLQTFEIYEDAAPVDAHADARADHSNLCCEITKVEVDGNLWGVGSTYPCLGADAGLVAKDPPWICFVPDAATCFNPACSVGLSCEGVNGTGKVIACPGEDQ